MQWMKSERTTDEKITEKLEIKKNQTTRRINVTKVAGWLLLYVKFMQ